MIYRVPRFSATCVAATLMAVALGCGGDEFSLAPVSGVVTLDGKPLENAVVRFAPQRQSDNPLVGPASHGITDPEGRYSLATHVQEEGAVVGQHMVHISTYQTRPVDLANSDEFEVVSKEVVPDRYRNKSELTFDVPEDGSDNANFELTSD